MSDQDRDREPVRPEPIRETERTTVIQTDRGRGGGGIMIAIILLIAVLALLFFLFGGDLTGGADKGDINVNVEAPELKLPDVDLKVPDVDIDVNNEPSENKG
ncbi:hypothetical protein [Sphingosinicella rhizophila]|uniref:SPOR domain-containing protein n=1 Tax=Sphingosinicella rhizophila TaxID=3050082 RepID=A0ABU3Q3B3_9SPHN|nr:hypothetical protein [Sphingosinicella sp. GR2756]MDT9597884.1 hypothetical protein [Sphingosinicella sp. GR2756]